MTTSTSPDKSKRKRLLLSGGAVLFWLAVWQAVSMAVGQEILLVSPVSAFRRLLQLIREETFWKSVFFSLSRVTLGFLSAALTGVVCGAAAYRLDWFRALRAPPVFTVKAAPVASFVILCLVWTPSRSLSVVISFLMVFPIVYLNLLEGLCAVDRSLLEMAKVFRLSLWKRIRAVYWPQCMPYLMSAFRLSLGLCWKSGIAAEIIGLPDGSIGERLYQAKIFLQTDDLFAWTAVIIGISVAFEKAFLLLLQVGEGVYGETKGGK